MAFRDQSGRPFHFLPTAVVAAYLGKGTHSLFYVEALLVIRVEATTETRFAFPHERAFQSSLLSIWSTNLGIKQ